MLHFRKLASFVQCLASALYVVNIFIADTLKKILLTYLVPCLVIADRRD